MSDKLKALLAQCTEENQHAFLEEDVVALKQKITELTVEIKELEEIDKVRLNQISEMGDEISCFKRASKDATELHNMWYQNKYLKQEVADLNRELKDILLELKEVRSEAYGSFSEGVLS